MAETRKKRRIRQKRGRTGASARQRERENAFRVLERSVGTIIQVAPAMDAQLKKMIDAINKRLPNMLPKKKIDPDRERGS